MNSRLSDIYNQLRAMRTELPGASAPLLLHAGPAWSASQTRLLIVGQETQGWGYSSEKPEDPSGSIRTWEEFRVRDGAVELLMSWYAQFAFAAGHPKNRGSPFWSAFRELAHATGSDVSSTNSSTLWTNLFRVDWHGGSVLGAAQDRLSDLMNLSGEVLVREIEALEPTAVVFFTGPRYDFALDAAFTSLKRFEFAGYPTRTLSQLEHPQLPRLSFRTYHPAYLSRSRQWEVISSIAQAIAGPDAEEAR